MKYILCTIFILAVATACDLQVRDIRSVPERAQTATARASLPISALEGLLRITVLTPPPVTIDGPDIAPNEASLLPTVTPTPKASE